GAVVIETAIPQQREVHLDLDYFLQDFAAYGLKDTLQGHKAFISYDDFCVELKIYVSYNRLENDSQPQSSYFGSGVPSDAAIRVPGAVRGRHVFGNPGLYFGDTGMAQSKQDNMEGKIGYEFDNRVALLNIAHEGRTTVRDNANGYLSDLNGQPSY